MIKLKLGKVPPINNDEGVKIIISLLRNKNLPIGLIGALDEVDRLRAIATLLRYVTEADSFYKIVFEFKQRGYLLGIDILHDNFIAALPIQRGFSQTEYWEITRIYYSIRLSYEILASYYTTVPHHLPSLEIAYDDNYITHNLDQVQAHAKRNLVVNSVEVIQELNKVDHETALKNLITLFAKTDYQLGTKTLQQEVELFKTLKDNIKPDIGKSTNPFPDVFSGNTDKGYLLFTSFTRHNIDPYADFSFIFQKMKADKFILNVKHDFFIEWLYKNKFLKERDYTQFKIKNKLRSLNKSTSDKRLNLYLKLTSELGLPQNGKSMP